MQLKKPVKMFFTLFSLSLVCSFSAFASDQEPNQTGVIDELKNDFNSLLLYGEILISQFSYKITHLTANTEEDNVTTKDDLDFWNNFKTEYPFSEKPVFISRYSVCRPIYDHVPAGISTVIITDNSGNPLDSYTVIKTETGFTIQKGTPTNMDHNYALSLNNLEELDEIYGNIGQIQDCEKYIKEQIKIQA